MNVFKTQIRAFVDRRKIQNNAILTQRIQQQDELIIFLASSMRDVTAIKYNFWICLSKRIPDISIITKTVKQQTQLTKKIQQKIPQILKNFSYSRILLQFITIYQIYVKLKLNISSQIKTAFKNLYIIKNQYIKIFKVQDFDIEAVMHEKTCVIFQSKVEKNKMGVIFNVSKNVTQVFGYKKQDILQHNINQVMPKSMQKEHDKILDSWRQRASWANIHKIRYIFAMTKDHVCFSTAIYLRIVQRMDSVNLLATFFKGNVNDYMIVNQQSIIDGVGNNFRKNLGIQIAKLPFPAICDNYDHILQNAKSSNEKKKVILTFYHIKGLQQLIQSYQISKYQLTNDQQDSSQIINQIKTKQRRIKISVQYQPYWMGAKFFILFKFLGISRSNSNSNTIEEGQFVISKMNRNSVMYINCSSQSSHHNQQPTQVKFCQYNSSLHTSNRSLSISTENIFLALQEKVRNSSAFANREVFGYCLAIFACFFVMICMLIAEGSIQKYFNQDFDDHMIQSVRFFNKFTSLALVSSRVLNINQLNKNNKFHIQRAIIQLQRVQSSISNQDMHLYLSPNTHNPPTLQRTVLIQDQNRPIKKILFDQYYTSYLYILKILYQKYIPKITNITVSLQRDMIDKNQRYLNQYVNSSLGVLEDGISGNNLVSIIISLSTMGLFILLTIVIAVIAFKFKQIQHDHNKTVLNIFMAVSDRNCEKCVNYFRSISNIFISNVQRASQTANQAQKIQTHFLESDQLISLKQKLQIQPDKFYRKKTLTNLYRQNSKNLKFLVFAFCISMVSGLAIKVVNQYNSYKIQNQFIENYFDLIQYQNNLTYNFLQIKQILSQQQQNYTTSAGQFLERLKNQFMERKSEDGTGFTHIYMNLLRLGQKFYPNNLQLNQTGQNLLCEEIRYNDTQFYQSICENSSYSFSKLKLFEIHSYIQGNLYDIICSIITKASTNSQNLLKLSSIEQAINLQYIALNTFITKFNSVSAYHHAQQVTNLQFVTGSFSSAFIIIMLFMAYYTHTISRNMARNCGNVLVIPEIVLRNTKGALKSIDDVLRAII